MKKFIQEKKEWVSLVKLDQNELSDIFNTFVKYKYKSDWTKEDFYTVKNSFQN